MLKRYILMPVALAAAGGVPYVAVNKDLSDQVQSTYKEWTQGAGAEQAETTLEKAGITPASLNGLWSSGGEAAAQNDPTATSPLDSLAPPPGTTDPTGAVPLDDIYEPGPVQAPLYQSLYDVIRFDVTPAWVRARWPRVSSGWLEDEYEGYRVPLVTGTTAYDMHGSMTYFFDRQQRAQRIRFVGQTGNLQPLAELVTQYHGFRAEESAHAGLFVRRFNQRTTGVLRLTHAATARDGTPQYEVLLEINSTTGKFKLSDELARMLDSEKLSGRW